MSIWRKHFISRQPCSSYSSSRNWQWWPLQNEWNFMTKDINSIFPSWTVYFYVKLFQQHLHMEYISLVYPIFQRLWFQYHDLLDMVLTRQLLKQGFLLAKLKWSLRNFYGRYVMTWLTITEYLCHKWPWMCSVCRNQNQALFPFMTYHLEWNKSNTTGAAFGAGITYISGAHEFPRFFVGFVLLYYRFLCNAL